MKKSRWESRQSERDQLDCPHCGSVKRQTISVAHVKLDELHTFRCQACGQEWTVDMSPAVRYFGAGMALWNIDHEPPSKPRPSRSRIMYVELKSGYDDNGPAWIGRVQFSKSAQSIYFRGRTLRRIPGGGFSSNYIDVDTGEQYWVSGVKKSQEDRHWAGGGSVEIDPDVRDEYLELIGRGK